MLRRYFQLAPVDFAVWSSLPADWQPEPTLLVALGQLRAGDKGLVTLDLNRRPLGDGGALALGLALVGNTSLQSLALEHCGIGSVGACGLCPALKGNFTLTSLSLKKCAIGSPGAHALGLALAGNATLQSLDLQWCEIGSLGVTGLCKALDGNHTLTQLSLLDNPLGDQDVLLLVAAMHINSPLDFKITTADLSPATRRTLQATQQRTAIVRLTAEYGASPLSRVRLCVCGDGEVGKTTLVLRLGGKIHQQVGSRTIGIDIMPLLLGRVHFSVWDFAGQMEFYATHELLLAGPASVFVVVVSLKQAPAPREAKLWYWLRFIASRTVGTAGAKPHVVLVATHADCAAAGVRKTAQGGLEVDWAGVLLDQIRLKFHGVLQLPAEFIVLNCLERRSIGLDRLTSALQVLHASVAKAAPQVPNCCSSSLLDILPALRQHAHITTVSDLFERAARHQPESVSKRLKALFVGTKAVVVLPAVRRDVLLYLAAIGEVVSMPQVARLADTVVLNPRWLTMDVLGPLLAPAALLPEHGLQPGPDGSVDVAKVKRLLRASVPQNMVPAVLEFMCSLDLCVMRGPESLVVPNLLAGTPEPGSVWTPEAKGTMQYFGRRVVCVQAWDMLSAGLFPRLQAMMHRLLVDGNPPKLWQGGLYGISQKAIEYRVTLTEQCRAIDVWVRTRSSPNARQHCREAVEQVLALLDEIGEGLLSKARSPQASEEVRWLELALSPSQLQLHEPQPAGYAMGKLRDCRETHTGPTHPPMGTLLEEVRELLGEMTLLSEATPSPDKDSCSIAVSPGVLTPMPVFHLFLSHNWGPGPVQAMHQRVIRIARALQVLGFAVFLDEDWMQGRDLDQTMSQGIDRSQVVLVFVTADYVAKVGGPNASDNCLKEFNYAKLRLGPERMVAVVLEEALRDPRAWPGPVGLNLAARLFVDMAAMDDVAPLVDHLAAMGIAPGVVSTSALPSSAALPSSPSSDPALRVPLSPSSWFPARAPSPASESSATALPVPSRVPSALPLAASTSSARLGESCGYDGAPGLARTDADIMINPSGGDSTA